MLTAFLPDMVNDRAFVEVYADWLDDQGLPSDGLRGQHTRPITRLTPAQSDLARPWKDHWMGVVRQTSHGLNRSTVQPLVDELYHSLGLCPPTTLVATSPLDAVMSFKGHGHSTPLSQRLHRYHNRSIQLAMEHIVNVTTLIVGLNEMFWAIADRTLDALRCHCPTHEVQSASDWDSVRHGIMYGAYDAELLFILSYMVSVCGATPKPYVAPLIKLSQHVGLWWAFDDIAVLSPPPTTWPDATFAVKSSMSASPA